MNVLLNNEFDKKEGLIVPLLLCSFFAPLWGVGYVLPFLLPLIFFVIKDYLKISSVRAALKSYLFPEITIFSLLSCVVLISSFYHAESKWGSAEGFWVILASFIFFVIGIIVGSVSSTDRLRFYLKIYFSLGFSLLIFTMVNATTFRGGVFDNINIITAVILMIIGALCGIFNMDLLELKSLGEGALLLLFVALAFYFSIKISSSDAAVPLLVGLFFFMSILAPSGRSFAVMWSFSLLILCVGVFMLASGKPLDFKSMLNVKKLESFLSFRPQGWFASLSMIGENPWLGVGSGQFNRFYEALLPLLPGKRLVLAHTHCLYLVHFVAHGIIAGLSFITLLALNLRLTFKALKDFEFAPFGLMLSGIWYFYLTYGLVELSPAFRELVPLVWGSSGLLAGI